MIKLSQLLVTEEQGMECKLFNRIRRANPEMQQNRPGILSTTPPS
jgi:hypothetical protein